LIQGENSTLSKKNFENYFTHIANSGDVLDGNVQLGKSGFWAKDNFCGSVLFARFGQNIIGVLGLDDIKIAKEIIATMFSRLSHLN